MKRTATPRSSSSVGELLTGEVQEREEDPWLPSTLYTFNITNEKEPLEFVGLNHHGGGQESDMEFVGDTYEWKIILKGGSWPGPRDWQVYKREL